MALGRVFAFAAFLRFCLVLYGIWHDSKFRVKYTDIDYIVFSDAAQHMVNGSSPYSRATYRYTPLLAILMTPNSFLHPSYGKFFFSICDLIVAWLILLLKKEEYLLDFSGEGKQTGANGLYFAAIFWLFNPFSLTISTRGNAESFQAILVLTTVLFAIKRKTIIAGIFFGLAIHFKIYPIIYTVPLVLHILRASGFSYPKIWSFAEFQNCVKLVLETLLPFIISAGFMLCFVTSFFYAWYNVEFIEHTYLYHLKRTDIKHNFSPYFYVLYLTSKTSWSQTIGVIAFLPQAISVIAVGVKYHMKPSVACFFQTFAFVTFNKVCTSQYFIWYLSLLPIAAGYMKISVKYDMLMMLFLWMSAQGIWLFLAYLLEFQGLDTFFLIWLASVWFFGVNIYVMLKLMSSISFQEASRVVTDAKKKK